MTDLNNTDMTETAMLVIDRNMTCLIYDRRRTGCHPWVCGIGIIHVYNLITDMESRMQFTQTFRSYVIPLYALINRLYYICLRL